MAFGNTCQRRLKRIEGKRQWEGANYSLFNTIVGLNAAEKS